MNDKDSEEYNFERVREDLENIPEGVRGEIEEVEVYGVIVEVWKDSSGDAGKFVLQRESTRGISQKDLKAFWNIIEKAKKKYYGDDYENEEMDMVKEKKKEIVEDYKEMLEKLDNIIYEQHKKLGEEFEEID